MSKKLLVLALAALVALLAGSAMADTITGIYGGKTFTADVTVLGSTAEALLGGPAGYTTDMVGIQVSSPLSSGSLTSGPSGWTGYDSNVGGGSTGSSCGTVGGNWLCASGPSVGISGLDLKWSFNGGNETTYSAWFQIFDPNGNFVGNFSCQVGENNSNCGGTTVPEPASFILLGTGLLGVGGLIRRRK